MRNVLDVLTKDRRIPWVLLAAILSLLVAGLTVGFDTPDKHEWPPRSTDVRVCATGAWGRLWYAPSIIEIPPDHINVTKVPHDPTQWYLEAASTADLVASLRATGLDEQQVQALLQFRIYPPDTPGCLLQPSDAFVLSLDAQVRARLYALLERFPRNAMHVSPFHFRGEDTQDWMEGTDLPPEVRELVRSLIYRRGKTQLFSDMPLVMDRYPSAELFSSLFQALSREATLLAGVRVLPEDNVDELARYWGMPNRRHEVRTLLRTSQATQACRDVPVAMLLPPFARDRVYRYWHKDDPNPANCHYTSLNFFNEQPDYRFTNVEEAARTLDRDYVEVTGHYQLGDVILLIRCGVGAVHSCNYIADRIVFTHNGNSRGKPWELTTLDALLDLYADPDPVYLKVMRRRDMVKR